MKIRGAVILGAVLLFGTNAFAQDYPKNHSLECLLPQSFKGNA
jgi:hypothetical protein